MKKLQVNTPEGWKYVFCYADGKVITLDDRDKAKALPSKAWMGEVDLAFFSNKFGNSEFKIA